MTSVASAAHDDAVSGVASDDQGHVSQSPPLSPTGAGGSDSTSLRSASSLSNNHTGSSTTTFSPQQNPIHSTGSISTASNAAYLKRNLDFHALFRNTIPEDEHLVADYACALHRDILVHGRLYFTENTICFYSNILGWVTRLTVSFAEVVAIDKRMTAFVIPNALQISTLHQKYFFASLVSRDKTYDQLMELWNKNHPINTGANLSSANGLTASERAEFGINSNRRRDVSISGRRVRRNPSNIIEEGEGEEDDEDVDVDEYEYEYDEYDGVDDDDDYLDDDELDAEDLSFEYDSDALPPLEDVDVDGIDNDDDDDDTDANGIPSVAVRKIEGDSGIGEDGVDGEINNDDAKNVTVDVSRNLSAVSSTVGNATPHVNTGAATPALGHSATAALSAPSVGTATATLSPVPAAVAVSAPESSPAPQSAPDAPPATMCPCGASNEHPEKIILDKVYPVPMAVLARLLWNITTPASTNMPSGSTHDDFIKNFVQGDKCKSWDFVAQPWKPSTSGETREINYVRPINAPVGPKSAKCIINETIINRDFSRAVTVDQLVATPDVPSGGAFKTYTRTCLMHADGSGKQHRTRLIGSFKMVWTGSSWFKSMIEKGSLDGNVQYFTDLDEYINNYLDNNKDLTDAKILLQPSNSGSTTVGTPMPSNNTKKPVEDSTASASAAAPAVLANGLGKDQQLGAKTSRSNITTAAAAAGNSVPLHNQPRKTLRKNEATEFPMKEECEGLQLDAIESEARRRRRRKLQQQQQQLQQQRTLRAKQHQNNEQNQLDGDDDSGSSGLAPDVRSSSGNNSRRGSLGGAASNSDGLAHRGGVAGLVDVIFGWLGMPAGQQQQQQQHGRLTAARSRIRNYGAGLVGGILSKNGDDVSNYRSKASLLSVFFVAVLLFNAAGLMFCAWHLQQQHQLQLQHGSPLHILQREHHLAQLQETASQIHRASEALERAAIRLESIFAQSGNVDPELKRAYLQDVAGTNQRQPRNEGLVDVHDFVAGLVDVVQQQITAVRKSKDQL